MSEDPIAFLASIKSDHPHAGRAHLWPLIIITLILIGVAVSVFGQPTPPVTTPGASGTPERQPRIYTVSYRFGVFSPTNLRIHAGDTVRFRNDSQLAIRIVAELQPGARTPEFDSVGQVQPGSVFSYTFSRTGTFGYYNNENGSESGVIIVR
jgi:plastocyanin